MAEVSRKINATKISLMRGDITRQAVDAIVNAANSGLLGGGGVDGAIHRAGGPAILAECKQLRDVQGPCAHVIHAVGPIWRGGTTNEADILASAYRTSLALAQAFELKTVAFPSISTGAYGYPVDLAAAVAIKTVSEFCQIDDSLEEVRFVLFDQSTFNAYADALNRLAGITL
jgi:O-acetyl-ADP-ribose deacetylase (regulator of RNase III)